MSAPFRNVLLWLLGSVVMIVGALSGVSSSYANGRYVPENEDAFYHARRMLDVVMNNTPVVQFDPKIHAPEGSWITWPWGFDTLMASITRLFGPFADVDHANRILMNIPPMMSVVAIALLVVLARQAVLSTLQAVILLLGFALLPVAFRTYTVGNVDHHGMEMLCTLGTITAGAWFFREGSRSTAAPIVLGLLLGFAVAMQNGLFILQFPICVMLAMRWLRGQTLPDKRQMRLFAGALIVSTLAACLPSEPFRRGFFEFYTLSWFHLYVGTVVAVFSVLLSQLAMNRRNLAIVTVLALLAILPLVGTVYYASSFITGSMDTILNISEAKSPYQLFLERGQSESTMYMSFLLLLMLPMMLVNLWWAWRRRDPAQQFIAIMCVFGLAFFQFQYRFSVFGMVPMLLTPLLVAKELAAAKPAWRHAVSASAVVLFVVSFLPTRDAWGTTFALGSHLAYPNLQAIWPRFAQLCHERPGIVLADIEAGHWIRYHTDCSVMSNVFLLTPQHAEKARENAHLMMLTPQQLLDERKDIRYVLAFHAVTIQSTPTGGETPVLEELRPRLATMERDLLGPEAQIPPQFKKRWEVRSPLGQIYARLYEIDRG